MNDAWAAGFIDGEGCFFIDKKKGDPAATSWKDRPRYTPRLTVANTRVPALTVLQELFGGNLNKRTRPKVAKDNWKDVWVWEAGGAKALLPIIDRLMPSLVIKRQEAALMKEFILSMKPANSSIRLTSEEWAYREVVFQNMKKLKE